MFHIEQSVSVRPSLSSKNLIFDDVSDQQMQLLEKTRSKIEVAVLVALFIEENNSNNKLDSRLCAKILSADAK